ncbi:MAG: DUF3429 domain-containing protein [Filomicrobium sp.]
MNSSTQIPRPALLLGWFGVVPFAVFSMLTIAGSVSSSGPAMSALILYGVVIASFMGGAQWGLAMVATGDDMALMGRQLAISVLPALAAFGLWFLPVTLTLFGLAALFVALLFIDIGNSRTGSTPAWYPNLRIQLTITVVFFLLLAALFGG